MSLHRNAIIGSLLVEMVISHSCKTFSLGLCGTAGLPLRIYLQASEMRQCAAALSTFRGRWPKSGAGRSLPECRELTGEAISDAGGSEKCLSSSQTGGWGMRVWLLSSESSFQVRKGRRFLQQLYVKGSYTDNSGCAVEKRGLLASHSSFTFASLSDSETETTFGSRRLTFKMRRLSCSQWDSTARSPLRNFHRLCSFWEYPQYKLYF